METVKILIVDDEPVVRSFLCDALADQGRQVVTAESGEDALAHLAADEFDLVLLDLKMQELSGMAVLDELRRRWPDTAVIVLTAHASLETAVEALRHGADDYLFKPSGVVELRESVRTALRGRRRRLVQRDLLTRLRRTFSDHLERLDAIGIGDSSYAPAAAETDRHAGRFVQRGGLIVDLARHRITLDGHMLELSPTEFDVLAYLAGEAPRVITARELVRAVQGYECLPAEARRLVRSHIYNIRRKMAATAGRKDVIRTVRGTGYALESRVG
jgi:DNA-binding response OmpR family regulator